MGMVGRDFMRMEGFSAGVKRKRGFEGIGEEERRGGAPVVGEPVEDSRQDLEGKQIERSLGGETVQKGDGMMAEGNGNRMDLESGGGVVDEETNDCETWTDEEILRLLEGVEMYGAAKRGKKEDVDIVDIMDVDGGARTDNEEANAGMKNGQDPLVWEKIGQHVATKTAKSCLLRFAKMDLEGEEVGGGEKGVLEQTAFSSAANPLASLLKFLGTAVTPGIAVAAAGEGLRVLVEAASMTGEGADGSGDRDAMVVDGKDDSRGAAGMKAPIPRDIVLKAAEAAARVGVEKAEELAAIEQRHVVLLVRALVHAITHKAELRMGILDGANEGAIDKAIPTSLNEEAGRDVSGDSHEVGSEGLGEHVELV